MANTTVKITKKMCIETLLNVLDVAKDTISIEGNVSYDDMENYLRKEIAALENKAIKAKERAVEKKAEGDELREKVLSCVPTDEAATIDEILAAVQEIAGPDVKRNEVISRLSQLGEKGTGQVTREEVSVSTEGKKSRKISAYRRID